MALGAHSFHDGRMKRPGGIGWLRASIDPEAAVAAEAIDELAELGGVLERESGEARGGSGTRGSGLGSALRPFVLVLDGDGELLASSVPFGQGVWRALAAIQRRGAIDVLMHGLARGGRTSERHWIDRRSQSLSLSLSLVVLPDAAGRPALCVVTAFQGERARRPGLANGRLVAEHPSPMWAIDRRTFRFVDANEAMCREVGLSRDELLARRMTDLLPWEAALAWTCALAEWNGRSPLLARTQRRKGDGALVDVQLTMVPDASRGCPLVEGIMRRSSAVSGVIAVTPEARGDVAARTGTGSD